MSTKSIITAAVAVALSAGSFSLSTNSVSAGERASAQIATVQLGAKRGNRKGTASIPFNQAPAWTAGCYAEFGPNAKNPDAKLLEICLSK